MSAGRAFTGGERRPPEKESHSSKSQRAGGHTWETLVVQAPLGSELLVGVLLSIPGSTEHLSFSPRPEKGAVGGGGEGLFCPPPPGSGPQLGLVSET